LKDTHQQQKSPLLDQTTLEQGGKTQRKQKEQYNTIENIEEQHKNNNRKTTTTQNTNSSKGGEAYGGNWEAHETHAPASENHTSARGWRRWDAGELKKKVDEHVWWQDRLRRVDWVLKKTQSKIEAKTGSGGGWVAKAGRRSRFGVVMDGGKGKN
jgi:hypothetical protein